MQTTLTRPRGHRRVQLHVYLIYAHRCKTQATFANDLSYIFLHQHTTSATGSALLLTQMHVWLCTPNAFQLCYLNSGTLSSQRGRDVSFFTFPTVPGPDPALLLFIHSFQNTLHACICGLSGRSPYKFERATVIVMNLKKCHTPAHTKGCSKCCSGGAAYLVRVAGVCVSKGTGRGPCIQGPQQMPAHTHTLGGQPTQ